MPPVQLVNPETGETVTARDEQSAAMIRELGFRDVSVGEQQAQASQTAEKNYYSGGWQQAQALGEGALRGLSFGLLGDGEEADLRAQYNPKTAFVGELGGAIAPAFLSGGESLLATAAEHTPVGLVSRGAAAAGEALGTSKIGRAAVTGAIDASGQVAGTALVDALHDRPETAEHVVAHLGVGTLLGGGLGALAGAIGAKLEDAGTKAQQAAARAAEAESVAASRSLADDFLTRGDVPVRLQRIDQAVVDARDSMQRSLAEATAAHASATADDLAAEATLAERAAKRAEVAGSDAYKISQRNLAIDYGAVPYHRDLKAFGDSLLDDIALDPALAKSARAEISQMRKAADEARAVIEDAKGTSVRKPRPAGEGNYDEIEQVLTNYRSKIERLAKKLGREGELPEATIEDAARTYHYRNPNREVGPGSDYVKGPRQEGEFYREPDRPAIAAVRGRKATKGQPAVEAVKGEAAYTGKTVIRPIPDLPTYTPRSPATAAEVAKVQEAIDSFKDFNSVKLVRASADDFLASAKKLDELMTSPYVQQHAKDMLKASLEDLGKHGFKFGEHAADLKGLALDEVAKALGLSKDAQFAMAQVPESARGYAASWLAMQSLEATPATLRKAAAAVKKGSAESTFLGRIVGGYVAGKAATAATALTGSRAAGYAVFHTVVREGIQSLSAATRSVQEKMANALAKFGVPAGKRVAKYGPTLLGRLDAMALEQVPGRKRDLSTSYREIAYQWKNAAGPNGANAFYAATAPLQQLSPSIANQVATQAQKVAAAVAARAPQDPGNVFRGMRSTWEPAEEDVARWLDYAEVAVKGPVKALEDLASGDLTAEGAQALRDLYPHTFGQVQQAVAERLVVLGDQLPYEDFIQITHLLGIPADGTMTPEFITAQQEMYLTEVQPPNQQPPPTPPPAAVPTKAQQVATR